MKGFDLEKAKAGHPVCTQDGRPARILCFDAKGIPNPIIALIDEGQYERIETYNLDGKYLDKDLNMNCLMMAGVKKEGWIYIWRDEEDDRLACGVYGTESEARAAAETDEPEESFVAVVKIEWEE